MTPRKSKRAALLESPFAVQLARLPVKPVGEMRAHDPKAAQCGRARPSTRATLGRSARQKAVATREAEPHRMIRVSRYPLMRHELRVTPESSSRPIASDRHFCPARRSPRKTQSTTARPSRAETPLHTNEPAAYSNPWLSSASFSNRNPASRSASSMVIHPVILTAPENVRTPSSSSLSHPISHPFIRNAPKTSKKTPIDKLCRIATMSAIMPQVRLDIPDEDHAHIRAAAALVGLTIAEFCAKATALAARRQLKESAEHLPHDTVKSR